jgi:hypothetical protein
MPTPPTQHGRKRPAAACSSSTSLRRHLWLPPLQGCRWRQRRRRRLSPFLLLASLLLGGLCGPGLGSSLQGPEDSPRVLQVRPRVFSDSRTAFRAPPGVSDSPGGASDSPRPGVSKQSGQLGGLPGVAPGPPQDTTIPRCPESSYQIPRPLPAQPLQENALYPGKRSLPRKACLPHLVALLPPSLPPALLFF